MKRPREDSLKEALNVLASTVEVPQPPPRLTGRVKPFPAMLAAAVVVAVVALVGVGAWWSTRPELQGASGDPAGAPAPESGVVVEHLRIHGKEVPAKVLELPGAGALVVMTGESRRGATGDSMDNRSLAAALAARTSKEYL